MADQIQAYAAAGMEGFVAKPIDVAALYAAIAKVRDVTEPADGRGGVEAPPRRLRLADIRFRRAPLVVEAQQLRASIMHLRYSKSQIGTAPYGQRHTDLPGSGLQGGS